MWILLAGVFAGLVHVLAGPDHLAAVAPIAADRPRRAWLAGTLWGSGHTVGVLAVGALALLLRGLLPLEAISSWSERLVGVALIGIGLWGLRQALLRRWHAHPHTHETQDHLHLHYHAPDESHEAPAAHVHVHMSLGMGVLHGLAGSAHVLGVLPSLALPTVPQSVGYLAAFGAGSILAMGLYGWTIGLLLSRLGRAAVGAYRAFLTGTAAAAIAVGVVWLVI